MDYFVKWWYFSFGKSFFETSRCSMFIIMSIIIPQNFTFFGIYLIFLNRVLKSGFAVYQISVDRTGRPNLRSKVHWATESLSVDRSGRPMKIFGRPTNFPVDRRVFLQLPTASFLTVALGLFCLLLWFFGWVVRGYKYPLSSTLKLSKRLF